MASGIVLEVVSVCVCLSARLQPTLPSTRPPHPGGFAPGWGVMWRERTHLLPLRGKRAQDLGWDCGSCS